MTKIRESIIDIIGNTPLLKLNNYMQLKDSKANIIAKLECLNPLGSSKDRTAYAMIKAGEDLGLITKDTTIIEPTSGNTGIGLAFICASRGYKLILTMPATMSVERRVLLKALGAQLVLTPGGHGVQGSIDKAEALVKSTPNSYMPQQFTNKANPAYHKATTAEEIWRDTDGNVDVFVCPVGTGGTISGIGEFLKEKNPKIQVIAVEPSGSPVLSGGSPGPHKIQGIGSGFIPEILNLDIIDEIIKVDNEDAIETSREIAFCDGVLAGVSSGAALFAATVVAKRKENDGKNIIVIFPDTGYKYLTSNLYSDIKD